MERSLTATIPRKQRRRQLFIDIAISLFGSRGYHETTVPMIVTDSKTSTGSFYIHFRSKEDVLCAAIESAGQQFLNFIKVTQTKPLETRMQLSRMVERMFWACVNHPKEARLLLVEAQGLGVRVDRIRAIILKEQIENIRTSILCGGTSLSEHELWTVAHCIVGSVCQTYCFWVQAKPENRPAASMVAHYLSKFALQAFSINAE